MIKNVLTHIGGVENYGILSILVFFAVFLGVIVWTLSRKKPYLRDMSALPLEDGERPPAQAPEQKTKSNLP
jgi:cbb3-type cytochrome oxidase subunit 3